MMLDSAFFCSSHSFLEFLCGSNPFSHPCLFLVRGCFSLSLFFSSFSFSPTSFLSNYSCFLFEAGRVSAADTNFPRKQNILFTVFSIPTHSFLFFFWCWVRKAEEEKRKKNTFRLLFIFRASDTPPVLFSSPGTVNFKSILLVPLSAQ